MIRSSYQIARIALIATAGLLPSVRTFAAEPQTVRVAVIGGMAETGFWQALGERFQKATGHTVEVVAYGPNVRSRYRSGPARPT